ncbi:MAG: DNA polymerase III subunit delta [Thermoanaerobacteraceae bacterium]|nr:DNA polymerase III subunit delta [Thermoanaerobacteraceae bacterium]
MKGKMNYTDFINSLKSKILPVYVFYGEEKFLLDDAYKKLKNILLNGIADEMNCLMIEEANLDNIIDACETLPFMSQHKLVVVKDQDMFKRLDDRSIKKLIDYIGNKNNDNILLFMFGDTIDMRKKFFKTIEKYGIIVNFERVKYKEAVNYTGYFIRKYGKTIKKPLAEFIVKNCGTDLYRIFNEVNKIIAYSENDEVSEKDIKAVVCVDLHENIFNLVNSIGLKKEAEAIYLLNRMINNGESGIVILSMIIRQFRNILKVVYLMQKNIDKKEYAARLSIHSFAVKDILIQSKMFSFKELIAAYDKCLLCDKALKSGHDARLSLENLIRKLCK